MPNANRPMGLIPVGHISGSPYNGQANIYCILAANTNAFAIGDPVVTDPGGADSRGIQAVTLAAATGAIRGVIVGISDTYPGSAKISSPESTIRTAGAKATNWYVMVVDDPDTTFEVQEVTGGTQLTVADVGLNANLIAGANNGFVSGWQLDNVGELTTATLQCRILGLVQRIDNEVGAAAKWLVRINNHELSAGVAGV